MTCTRSALEGIKVVEISGVYGGYCGKLFADLGATVVLVEPPAGSPLRYKPPFMDGAVGPDASLSFAYLAANKQSATIDLATEEGLRELSALAQQEDLIILADHPDASRVDLAQLRRINPALVCTAITPFGRTGPYAGYIGDDLTLMAMGGLLCMGGYPGAAPVVAYGEQAYRAAEQFAAAASLAAVLRAERTGVGEEIDVSIQESVLMALENAAQTYQLEGRVRTRAGGASSAGAGIFSCKDGEIYLLAGGIGTTNLWSNFIAWLTAELVPGAATFADPAWSDVTFLASEDAHRQFATVFEPYARTKTKAELYAAGRQWRVPIAPMSAPEDILASGQLRHRGFFVPAPEGAACANVLLPGAPYKLSRTPWRLQTAAPRLEAVNSRTNAFPSAQGVKRLAQSDVQALPLAGVKVIDFCWVGAGSYTTRLLADLGADVIKIESRRALDGLRLAAPYKDGIKGVNRSGYFADRNSSKRSLTVNMKSAEGQALVRELLRDCDVVANNFTPGAMERLGVGYEQIVAVNPQVIYLAMSMNGSDGPDRDMVGYGITIAALTGFLGLSGTPDLPPTGTGTNFPDHVPNPCHAAFAVLAALRHKAITGEGQMIDMAQTEPMLTLLADAIIDFQVNGRAPIRTGNRLEGYAPRGVYPAGAKDRWIAISIATDKQWAALTRVLDHAALSREEWRHAAGRKSDQDAIDAALAGATASWNEYELMQALQASGVPCGVVQHAADLVDRDLQLKHRRHWRHLPHAEMGPSLYNAPPFRFASIDVGPRFSAPLLGEHTHEICKQRLGMTASQIDALIESGVLT